VALNQTIFALSTSLTLTIGLISFFIVYNTSKKINDDIIQEFSQRLLILIGVMMLFLTYWSYYTAAFERSTFRTVPIVLGYNLCVPLFDVEHFVIQKTFAFSRRKTGENVERREYLGLMI